MRLSFHGGLWSSACTELLPDAQLFDFADQGVIVPQPGSPGRYFVFLTAVDTTTLDNYLGAVQVDAEANGGEGAVIGGLMDLGVGRGEALTVVPGTTEDTLWLWTSSVADNALLALPITQAGIGPAQSGLSDVYLPSWFWSQMKAARTNDRIAFTAAFSPAVRLARISPNGAHGSDLIILDQPGAQAVDLEFSPDGRYLYTAAPESQGRHIWQYDLSTWQSDAIFASRVAVEGDSALPTRALQLGPDDRIYTWTGDLDSTSLSVIEHPNAPGVICGHELYSIPLDEGVDLEDVDFRRPNLWWPRDWPTGLPETRSSNVIELEVIPTPASNEVLIRLPKTVLRNGVLSVIGTNTLGQQLPMIAESMEGGCILRRGDAPAGVYHLRIREPGKVNYRATVMWVD
ncbi:MAG: hypothetical protein JNM91_01435 [Flavobacteriales bacterium]|nr:hypothetical protein [Flavobacteriales bacterium]